jgi:hypothetical protein
MNREAAQEKQQRLAAPSDIEAVQHDSSIYGLRGSN